MGLIRILFLSDTHLGFDDPQRPRVERTRRGPDFFVAMERALQPATNGEVDLVIHGGDLLYRSRVPSGLVARAFQPLRRVADSGIPVVLVPGNHERSAIPHRIHGEHERIHIFHRPATFSFTFGSLRLAVSGFPHIRHDPRDRFHPVLEETGWRDAPADVRLLCLHQCVEGATVGPGSYTFRGGPDVIRGRDLPGGFAAILCGHIHRRQVLTRDLAGRPLSAPVLHPGSTERTSFAEMGETKGAVVLDLSEEGLQRWFFRDLPSRPMVRLDLDPCSMEQNALEAWLRERLGSAAPDSIVKIRLTSVPCEKLPAPLHAERLRGIAPPGMIVTLSFPR